MLRDVNLSLLAGTTYEEMEVVHRFLSRVILRAPEAIRIADLWNTRKQSKQDGRPGRAESSSRASQP